MSDLIREAIAWAEDGIPVFPCGKDKAPLTKNGFHDAESDPAKVRQLFEFYGNAAKMIGGRMGDGLFAVDVDLYKGEEPKAWLKARIDDGEMPDTRTHETARGGLHFLYEGDVASCNPAPGVEIKGEGGYIILPGTPGYKVKQEGIVPAPPSLISLIRSAISSTRGSTEAQLKSNVLSGADFHNSLATLASRWAYDGKDQVEIQQDLIRLLDTSTAKDPNHDRHHRWRKIMADAGGELSRIATSAYNKFNTDAVQAEASELTNVDLEGMEEVFHKVFTDTPNFEPQEVQFDEDVWPFDGQGYWANEDHDLTDADFVMYPIYAENETVVLFAEPKTGKTAVAVTTALHISCGMDLGNFKVADAGPCVYYALEGSRAIRMRVEAWKKEMRERDVKLPDRIPMFVIEKPANFLKETVRESAAAQIIAANKYAIKHQGAPLKAIFIDTLTKAMSGGDQNSVEDTSSMFEIVNLIRAGGVRATIIFVHHKARTGNVRGSSNIEAEPDMLLDVSKEGDVIKLRVARARSIEDGASFHFIISGVDLGQTKQGHPLSSMFVEPLMAETDERHEDPLEAQKIAQQRKVITQLGDCDASEVVAAWFEQGLIKGKKARGKEVEPNWQLPEAQKALHQVANDPGGAIYGDYVIRPDVQDKKVVGFKVKPFG